MWRGCATRHVSPHLNSRLSSVVLPDRVRGRTQRAVRSRGALCRPFLRGYGVSSIRKVGGSECKGNGPVMHSPPGASGGDGGRGREFVASLMGIHGLSEGTGGNRKEPYGRHSSGRGPYAAERSLQPMTARSIGTRGRAFTWSSWLATALRNIRTPM